MHLALSDAESRFRDELRDWLVGVLPDFASRPHSHDSRARYQFDARWQRAMYDAGWAGVSWPCRFGGRDATLIEQLVYHEVTAALDAPAPGLNFVGLYHAGPTLMRVGTDEQRERFLPPILRGEAMWCQGFSEPDAGSDLASLRCRASVEDDAVVVNGTKIWTSNAHVANWCELLVRTDPDAELHRGLTYLLCDMRTPGIEIRNIVQIDGCPEFNEVVFHDVRVPHENVLGSVGDGWNVAMTTLGYERSTAFVDREVRLGQSVRGIAQLAARRGAMDDATLERIGRVAAEAEAMRAMASREMSRLASGADPGAEGSVLKLYFAELDQRLGRLAMDLLGDDVVAYDGEAEDWTARYLRSLSSSIAAGTSQIQRNIVGERVLGLPRDRGPVGGRR